MIQFSVGRRLRSRKPSGSVRYGYASIAGAHFGGFRRAAQGGRVAFGGLRFLEWQPLAVEILP
jgi:hypothetical protein